jgi:hypothetical protein
MPVWSVDRPNEPDWKRIAWMRDGDGLESHGGAAFRDDRIPTKKLIEKRLGLHPREVNAEAR